MKTKNKFQLILFLIVFPIGIYKSYEVATAIFKTSWSVLTIVAIIGAIFLLIELYFENLIIKKTDILFKGVNFPTPLKKFREFCFRYGVIVLFFSIGFNPLSDILTGKTPMLNPLVNILFWDLATYLFIIGTFFSYLYMAYDGVLSLFKEDDNFKDDKNIHPFYD